MFNPNSHLMNLKGKDYLQVMWRLVWFREDKPLWNIDTNLVSITDNHAIFNAKIYDENGMQKASGYGSESVKDFKDFIEKAETKAIGRALAMLGYGTQFTAEELDEGERIVDSPVEREAQKEEPKPEEPKTEEQDTKVYCAECAREIKPYLDENGKGISVERHVKHSIDKFGSALCLECIRRTQLMDKIEETYGDPT